MQILQGTRIVSFNHYLMGPLAIQHLADLGADVIAVEAVDGAWHRHWGGANRKVDGQSVLFLAANRNKRSLAVNFKSAKGLEVMEAMGLGYDDLRREHPRLIYASASGYGQDGPYAKRPGQDLPVQAMSGLAAITGNAKDRARPAGVSVVDHHGRPFSPWAFSLRSSLEIGPARACAWTSISFRPGSTCKPSRSSAISMASIR